MGDKCGACDGCRAAQALKATRNAAKNKRDKEKASKELKRVEHHHPCTGREPREPAPKKVRRGEADLLGASIRGGRYHGDAPSLHDAPLAREDRAARSLADLNEDNFNAAAFDEYSVTKCTSLSWTFRSLI